MEFQSETARHYPGNSITDPISFSAQEARKRVREKVEQFLDKHRKLLKPGIIRKLMNWRNTPQQFVNKDATQVIESLRWRTEVSSGYGLAAMHPRIRKECSDRFDAGLYADAILAAYKVVIDMVKKKTGSILDGKNLMEQTFTVNDPVIRLNSLKTVSDKNEQEGFKDIYMGAVVGIRNPKAHDIIHQLDRIRTLEYLALASLLARRVDEGTVRNKSPERKTTIID